MRARKIHPKGGVARKDLLMARIAALFHSLKLKKTCIFSVKTNIFSQMRAVLLTCLICAAFALPNIDLVSELKKSKAYQVASAKMRADRIKAGLSPEIIPHRYEERGKS
jgi:hypothetical protein